MLSDFIFAMEAEIRDFFSRNLVNVRAPKNRMQQIELYFKHSRIDVKETLKCIHLNISSLFFSADKPEMIKMHQHMSKPLCFFCSSPGMRLSHPTTHPFNSSEKAALAIERSRPPILRALLEVLDLRVQVEHVQLVAP